MKKGIGRMKAGAGLMVLAAALGIPGAAGDTMYLKSGKIYTGKILGFNEGAFEMEIEGATRRAPAIYVDRVEFAPPEPPPPSAPPADEMAWTEEAPAPEAAVEPAAAEPAPAAVCSGRMVLTTHWQSRIGRGNISIGNTARLLSGCGTPQIDLAGKPIAIWGKITYLMPVQEAKQLLGLGSSSRSVLTCAAFPADSFFGHAFPGNYEDGFNQLYLITDYANQVVGVQLQDNTSRGERWFPDYPGVYSAEWSLYNFVNDRKKGNSNWLIGFYVCQGARTVMGYPPRAGPMFIQAPTGVNEGVVRVDSDLFSITRNRYDMTTDAKSRERNRLLLAQPVVDLMLYIAQKSR